MRKSIWAYVLAGVALLPASATAQLGFGFAPHVGTLGLGLDVSMSMAPKVAVRVGGSIFPSTPDITWADIDYSVELPSPQFMALLDLSLLGGLRVSGGAMISSKDFEATGTLAGSVEIGGTVYSGTDVGSLTGAIVNKSVAPYLGIGFGNPGSSKFGFFLDLGVAFHGTPEVLLTATGPVTATPGFLADLEAERLQFEDDISRFTVYPVVKIGFSIGFPSVPMVPGV